VLLAVEPATVVAGAISESDATLPVVLASFPKAEVNIAIRFDQPAETLLLVINKVAIVTSTIWPDL